MTFDDRAGGVDTLFSAATADVPTRHQQAPLTVIHGRVDRRRRTTRVLAAAAVTPVLVGGYLLSQHLAGQPARHSAAVTAPFTTSSLPWVSAMTNRDGTAITVYVGPNPNDCQQVVHPQATITQEDGNQIVVAVAGSVVRADDCSTSGWVVPVVVSTSTPVGSRVVRDSATGQPRPTYSEQDLPDLRSDPRWTPIPSPSNWYASDETWYASYNGPTGWGLNLTARRSAAPADQATTGTTIMLGSHRGSITELTAGFWTVSWTVGDAIYSLQIEPAEGGSLTLKQFKQELTRLAWS